jgi:hypothetical protein
MYVYVVGWHPSVDSGANGGFEWRYSRDEALKELLCHVADELVRESGHNFVFAKVRVPFGTGPYREDEVTDWLDHNLHLIELPLQEETITA